MITKLTTDLNNIQSLNDEPNDVTGLTPAELKAVWDKAGNDIKTYINNTLTVETDLKESSSNITTNRKLSATGDFTGTLNGGPITASEQGLQATVIALGAKVDAHLVDNLYQTATGTATAITLTISETLVTGFPITFISSANNAGAATTINTKKAYKPGTTTSPTLIAGKAYTFWYNFTGDSGNGCFFIKASGEGTALIGDVLAGKTFTNDNDTLAGTLTLTGTTTTADVAIGKTFYNTDAKTKLTGNGTNAKRTASGTAYYVLVSGNLYSLTVTGLSFAPSVVVFKEADAANSPIGIYSSRSNVVINMYVFTSISYSQAGSVVITSDGFTSTSGSRSTTTPVYWTADE